MKKIIAIDPGTVESGFALMSMDDYLAPDILDFGNVENETLVDRLSAYAYEEFESPDSYVLVVEDFINYGMAVGQSTIKSIRWSGRFLQAALPIDCALITRPTVKNSLCRNTRANDSNVRQAILDRYPETGGGACPQKGTKKQPGPLYGVSKHVFSTIALGMTYMDPETDLQAIERRSIENANKRKNRRKKNGKVRKF